MEDAREGGQGTGRGRLAPALALVGATLLALAALTSSWWRADDPAAGGSFRIGLVRAEICGGEGQDCRGRRLAELGLEAPWAKTASASFAAALVVAALSALLALLGPGVGWRASLAWVVAVLSLFAAVMMIVAHLMVPFDDVRPGWGLIAAFVGLAVSLLAAGIRLTQRRSSSRSRG